MGTGVSPKRIDTGNLSFPGFQSLIVILENSTVYKTLTSSSLERRVSSRTFRYGYLVTTSPPVIGPAFGSSLLTVGSLTSGITDSHGVTGGVYKTRERIHRDILIRDY